MTYRFIVEGFQVCECTDIVPEILDNATLAENADDIPCCVFACDCDAMDTRGHDLDDPRKGFSLWESDEGIFETHVADHFDRDIVVSLTGFFDEILEGGG